MKQSIKDQIPLYIARNEAGDRWMLHINFLPLALFLATAEVVFAIWSGALTFGPSSPPGIYLRIGQHFYGWTW